MGKKIKAYEKLIASLQQQLTQQAQPSPFENILTQDFNTTRDWLNKKDYRNLPDGVNIDLIGLGDQQKMRSMLRGSDAGAQRAAGANFAPMVQSQRELDDNQFQQDWSGAYEDKVGGLMNKNMGLANTLQGLYTDRQDRSLQGGFNMLQAINNQPKKTPWWQTALNFGMQAAPSIISAF